MRSGRNFRALLLGGICLGIGAFSAVRRAPAPAEPAPHASAAAVEWDLPVATNGHVTHWIHYLSGANREHTELWMERSGRYEPMIRERLRMHGMPEDLVYLAFIESGFSPRAYSPAHASGMWQFIRETGQRYGLEVTSYVDERRDPVRATDAAIAYLQDLYDQFGSWYLAAAAYNSGENRVRRVLREVTGRERGSDADFWRIAPHLPRETRNYVPLMLAAGHVSKEPEKYGFDGVEYQDPLRYDSVFVRGETPLAAVAKTAGVPADQVKDLNPHLVRGETPPKGPYPVRIPPGRLTIFARNLPQLAQAERAARAAARSRIYVVRRGDTLGHIARRNGVSVLQLRKWNGIGRRGLIRPGQKLRVRAT